MNIERELYAEVLSHMFAALIGRGYKWDDLQTRVQAEGAARYIMNRAEQEYPDDKPDSLPAAV